ncbi:MAG: nucleotidyltransferase family protein [Reyranella sp.]|uniref:nucleotidyltransferase family protein n=1 Tax=Reyranella sp. TaxID=1929291 RepID=UPI003D0E028D
MTSIAAIITQDPVAMIQLRAVRELALPDWCIAAGFVRNRVWDHLHGIVPAREPVDIDCCSMPAILEDGADHCLQPARSYTHRFKGLSACT